jgi:hypothetical protein
VRFLSFFLFFFFFSRIDYFLLGCGNLARVVGESFKGMCLIGLILKKPTWVLRRPFASGFEVPNSSPAMERERERDPVMERERSLGRRWAAALQAALAVWGGRRILAERF